MILFGKSKQLTNLTTTLIYSLAFANPPNGYYFSIPTPTFLLVRVHLRPEISLTNQPFCLRHKVHLLWLSRLSRPARPAIRLHRFGGEEHHHPQRRGEAVWELVPTRWELVPAHKALSIGTFKKLRWVIRPLACIVGFLRGGVFKGRG